MKRNIVTSLASLLLLCSWLAYADTPALRIDVPDTAMARRPFTAMVYLPVTSSAAALAFQSGVVVTGHTITATFEFGCGFLCPGAPDIYGPFPLQIPALQAGEYTLVVNGATSPPLSLGSVTFVIAAQDVSVPTLRPVALATFGLGTLCVGCYVISANQRTRRSRRRKTSG